MSTTTDWNDSIVAQLAEATATSEDGDHLVLLFQVEIICSDTVFGPAQQASAYLSTGEWEGSHHPCADLPDCVRPEHVSPVTMTEEEIDQLVSKASRPSLATLYKRARATGLVPATTGNGYF